MGTSAPHIQSQVHRHRANWRGLVVVLILVKACLLLQPLINLERDTQTSLTTTRSK